MRTCIVSLVRMPVIACTEIDILGIPIIVVERQVNEEYPLADSVVATPKLLIAIEAET
jgi:hypothetical protein